MRKTISVTILAALAALTACEEAPPPQGGQFGEETGGGCIESVVTDLALDEVAPNGLTAQQLADLIEGEHVEAMTWADGGADEITIAVTDLSDPRYIEYEEDTSQHQGDIEPDIASCLPTVAVDVQLAISTPGGELNESYAMTLEMEYAEEVWLYLDLDALTGTLDPAAWATEDYDAVSAHLSATFSAGGVSGEISGTGEASGGEGDGAWVSAAWFEIATF